MRHIRIIPIVLLIALSASIAFAQTDDAEALKVTALEALIAAPPERALPIVRKVLDEADANDDVELLALEGIDGSHPKALSAIGGTADAVPRPPRS